MRVSFLIVTYNSSDTILDCLQSIKACGVLEYEIIILDNASVDNSVSLVRGCTEQVELIELDENIGFGAGINRASKRAKGDYIFILNPDSMVEVGCVDTLVEHIEQNPHCGMVGPSILDNNGNTIDSCFKFTGLIRSWQIAFGNSSAGIVKPVNGKRVDWINGAALMLRMVDFLNVNGFDEDFFLYSEEEDLAIRLHQSGKTVDFCSEAKVVHLGAVSASSQVVVARVSADWSRHYLLRKHRGNIVALLSILVWVPALFVRAMVKWTIDRDAEILVGYMESVKSLIIPGYYNRNLRPSRSCA